MITNGYATLQQYKDYQAITTSDVTDDLYIENVIEAASRWIDRESGTRFYIDTETRHYDVPEKDTLLLDAHFTAITSVTNGDGTSLTVSQYATLPANETPLYGIKIKPGSTWLNSGGNTIQVITVVGSVGYSSSAPSDIYVGCLEIAKALYGRRFGENMTTKTVITPSGVIQIPEGVPDMVAITISHYRRIGFA